MSGLHSGRKRTIPGIIVSVVLLVILAIPGRAGGGAPKYLDPGEAQALIRENSGNRNFVVLDVRTPGEFAQGHLEGAVMVDYHSPEFRQQVARLDRTKTYLVYCRTGSRSSRTTSIMNELGFQHIYHLEGGIMRWQEEGLPAVR